MLLVCRNATTSLPNLGIMIEQDITIGAGKRQGLPELLHDPLASWMCRAVEMVKAAPTMFDDKEAIECLKRQRRNSEEVKGGDHFRDGCVRTLVSAGLCPGLHRARAV